MPATPPAPRGGAGAPALPVAGVLACLLAAGACVGPTTTHSAYQDKAQQTAASMIGIIGSAQVTTDALLAGRATRPFADTQVSRAEGNARWVRTAFDSRQPPDGAARRLRARVDPPLSAAVSALADLRIAVRDDDRAAVRAALRALDGPRRRFDELAEHP